MATQSSRMIQKLGWVGKSSNHVSHNWRTSGTLYRKSSRVKAVQVAARHIGEVGLATNIPAMSENKKKLTALMIELASLPIPSTIADREAVEFDG